MVEISDEISRHYSPALPIIPPLASNIDSSISTQELLEVSQNISQYFAPKISPAIKRLVLLPIDPNHIYVYWNFDDETSSFLMHKMSRNELSLRIYPQVKKNGLIINSNPVYDIPVHNFHSQKKITLPHTQSNTSYSAYIGSKDSNDHFVAVLKSNQTPSNNHENIGNSLADIPVMSKKTVNQEETHKTFEQDYLYTASLPVKSHYASSHHSGKGHKKQQ